MRDRLRDRLGTILKIAISLSLIAYLLLRIDLAAVGQALVSAKLGFLLLDLLCTMSGFGVNSVRWLVLLRAVGIDVPWRSLLEFTFVGAFFNNFLPTTVGGDIMRGFSLAQRIEHNAEAAVSVVMDRVIALLAFMTSALIASLVALTTTQLPVARHLTLAAALAWGALVIALLVMLSTRLRAMAEGLFRVPLLSRLAPPYSRVSTAFDAYRHKQKALALAFGVALVDSLVTNLGVWFAAQALGADIPVLIVYLFNPLVMLIAVLPITIGGLGLSQSSYVYFYGLMGVSAALALAMSLLQQVVVYAATLPGGILWWQRRGDRRPWRSLGDD